MHHHYNGTKYPTRTQALTARKEHYFQLISNGINFTQAAKTVGV